MSCSPLQQHCIFNLLAILSQCRVLSHLSVVILLLLQLTAFSQLLFPDGKPMVKTYRPLQPMNGRQVYYSSGNVALVSTVLPLMSVLVSSALCLHTTGWKLFLNIILMNNTAVSLHWWGSDTLNIINCIFQSTSQSTVSTSMLFSQI